MTAATLALKQRAAWKKLQAHFKVMGRRHVCGRDGSFPWNAPKLP